MGGEGSNWIGEAPFSKTPHVFQNLGDGTYIHSGSLAIRAARAAGVNMTYKILYNDAVAMTGGQSLDGGMTVSMILQQVLGRGHREGGRRHRRAATSIPPGFIPQGVPVYDRRDLQKVQQELRDVPGVSVLLYDQTCAAEKRRRRKRGLFPDPDKRVFINPAVCEGCGDCGVKSNCVAVSPLETELGTKRTIDQSQCNKDFSCLNGFCPSFVTVHGAKVKKARRPVGETGVTAMLASLPEPNAAGARPSLYDAGDRRRRHGRRDRIRDAGPGRASGRQGLRRHRHDGPRPEGRRGGLPYADSQGRRADPCDPRRRGRGRPGARLRPGGDGLQQGAGDDQAGSHGGGVFRLRDVDRGFHPQGRSQDSRRGAAARHCRARGQGAGAPLRCPHGRREAVRRLHCRQRVPARLCLPARLRADRRGGHRAGDRAQWRGGRDEQGRLPLRSPGGARHGRDRAHDGAGQDQRAEAADARRHRRLSRGAAHRAIRMRSWPTAIARALPSWPRSSAARPPGARASPRRPRGATTSCSPTRTSTRSRACSPMPPSTRR